MQLEELYNTSAYNINNLSLYTSGGDVIDIRNLALEIDVFEDIFSPAMTCTIRISDGHDLISVFKFHGNEFLELEIDKPGLDFPLKKIFRLYKVSDRSFDANMQNYTLHFCSEELMLSSQTFISKSYRGLNVSSMVQDILNNYLKVKSNKIANLEETGRAFDLIIPRMQPLEAIMWLTTKAYSPQNTLYFFFENREGFNFISYESLIKRKPYSKYYKDFKVTSEPTDNINSFNMLTIIDEFDTLKASRYGSFSSSIGSLDIISRSFDFNPFNAVNMKNKGILNKEVTMNLFRNRLEQTYYDSYENMFKYMVVNDYDTSRNPIAPEEWVSQTASKMGQINLFKMVGTIPGDVLIKTGDVVEVEIPNVIPQDKFPETNPTRSGNYLVSTVHHKFVGQIHSTVLELLSDSINDFMPYPVNNSNKLKELRES